MDKKLYYDDKDLYEGLIIEIDVDTQTQIAMVLPAGREYGHKFAAAPLLIRLVREHTGNYSTLNGKTA